MRPTHHRLSGSLFATPDSVLVDLNDDTLESCWGSIYRRLMGLQFVATGGRSHPLAGSRSEVLMTESRSYGRRVGKQKRP